MFRVSYCTLLLLLLDSKSKCAILDTTFLREIVLVEIRIIILSSEYSTSTSVVLFKKVVKKSSDEE